MTDMSIINPTRKLIRLREVVRQTGASKSTIYRWIADRDFPAPVKLGERCSAWVGAEIDRWIAERIATRDAA